MQALFDARAAGQINAATPLTDASDLIQRARQAANGGVTGSLTWTLGGFQIGGFANYIGTVYDTNFLDANGNPYVRRRPDDVQSLCAISLQGRRRSTTRASGSARATSSTTSRRSRRGGYLGSLYMPYGRYWYASVGTRF